eukprot:6241032-Prymnesium_polylepis.1
MCAELPAELHACVGPSQLLGLSADEYQRKSGKPPISLEAFREARRQRAAATGVVPAPPTPPPPKDP